MTQNTNHKPKRTCNHSTYMCIHTHTHVSSHIPPTNIRAVHEAPVIQCGPVSPPTHIHAQETQTNKKQVNEHTPSQLSIHSTTHTHPHSQQPISARARADGGKFGVRRLCKLCSQKPPIQTPPNCPSHLPRDTSPSKSHSPTHQHNMKECGQVTSQPTQLKDMYTEREPTSNPQKCHKSQITKKQLPQHIHTNACHQKKTPNHPPPVHQTSAIPRGPVSPSPHTHTHVHRQYKQASEQMNTFPLSQALYYNTHTHTHRHTHRQTHTQTHADTHTQAHTGTHTDTRKSTFRW